LAGHTGKRRVGMSAAKILINRKAARIWLNVSMDSCASKLLSWVLVAG
jgi:hypothetical protein